MRTRIINIIIALAGILALSASCQREDFLLPEASPAEDGHIRLNVSVEVPDMDIVQTKAVDPDGGGVQRISVFCFDKNGLFITTMTADIVSDGNNPSLEGTFSVSVPDYTETLQLVGNQNMTYFREDDYRGMSEVDVMAALEASAGRMIYWARKSIADFTVSNPSPVKLLRNQAKISLNIDSSVSFEEKGWIVVNSNAFGTVAPYSPDHGGFVAPTVSDPFVTLPDNRAKLGDYLDVRTNDVEYIFETENTPADPVDFILKGSQKGGPDLYYRISLIDENGDNVMIMRNHHYTVNVVGELYYGQQTFQQALEAPATNNVSPERTICSYTDRRKDMASTSGYTQYYDIYKPATNERYDIGVFWEAFDIIDTQMHDNEIRDGLQYIDFSNLSAQQIADLKTALGIS